MAVIASWMVLGVGVALLAACPKTMVVDSLIALDIDARTRTSEGNAGLADVEIFFRDISLADRVVDERRVGSSDSSGTYRGSFGYFWGRQVRGDPARQPVRPRKFALIFRRAGFKDSVVEFDLDKLPATAVNTYAIRVEVQLSPSTVTGSSSSPAGPGLPATTTLMGSEAS
jgi:hypothetical protein